MVNVCESYVETTEKFARDWEDLIMDNRGVKHPNEVAVIRKWRSTFRRMMNNEADWKILVVLRTELQSAVHTPVLRLKVLMSQTDQVIRKRAQKLLDFNHVRSLKASGALYIDPVLQASADDYGALNQLLIDELPLLLGSVQTFTGILMGRLIDCLNQYWYQAWHDMLLTLIPPVSPSTNLVQEYQMSMKAQETLRKMYDLSGGLKEAASRRSSIEVLKNVPLTTRDQRTKSVPTLQDISLIDFGDDEPSATKASSEGDVKQLMDLFMQTLPSAATRSCIALPTSMKLAVIYPYRALKDDELTCDMGMQLVATKQTSDGKWYFCRVLNGTKEGFVPINHCSSIS
jgi:hypothetical protein